MKVNFVAISILHRELSTCFFSPYLFRGGTHYTVCFYTHRNISTAESRNVLSRNIQHYIRVKNISNIRNSKITKEVGI